VFNEVKTEKEQENILRAIYNLAINLWMIEDTELPILPDDKFMFLYFVYIKSETDVFARVEADEIQNELSLPQHTTISIGQYLCKHELIIFSTWVGGIKIDHKGVVRVEADLLGSSNLPSYVTANEVGKIEERIRLRFDLLQQLFNETEGDTFKKIMHIDLARKLGIIHHRVISEFLPYLAEEGWIKYRTVDTVTITEEGIDKVKALLI
jgi:hypothetical protein